MTDARKQKCRKVISDFFSIFPWRNCIVWFSLFISLILLLLMLYNDSITLECIHKIEDNLYVANISVMSIDLAALAILFALFQDKILTSEAKKAFKEQCGVFIFNAVVQLLALVIFIICSIISIDIFLYVTFLIQIWAIILVFDVIVELFTLISAILNK